LNKLDNAELEQHKKHMEKDFVKNQKKPGEEGFEYDKRVEFKPKVKVDSGWDDSEDNFDDMDEDFF
jgi:hypothetical protein